MLTRVEAGDLSGWVEFVRWTDCLPKPISDDSEWAALAPHDRERILIAALRYLQDADAPGLAWLDVPNEFPWTTVAARSALQACQQSRVSRGSRESIPDVARPGDGGHRRVCRLISTSSACAASQSDLAAILRPNRRSAAQAATPIGSLVSFRTEAAQGGNALLVQRRGRRNRRWRRRRGDASPEIVGARVTSFAPHPLLRRHARTAKRGQRSESGGARRERAKRTAHAGGAGEL